MKIQKLFIFQLSVSFPEEKNKGVSVKWHGWPIVKIG